MPWHKHYPSSIPPSAFLSLSFRHTLFLISFSLIQYDAIVSYLCSTTPWQAFSLPSSLHSIHSLSNFFFSNSIRRNILHLSLLSFQLLLSNNIDFTFTHHKPATQAKSISPFFSTPTRQVPAAKTQTRHKLQT
jgi:hypothetical protein